MKIKVPIKKAKASEECKGKPNFDEVNAYQSAYRKFGYSVPELRNFLSQEYRRIFPDRPYPDGQPMKLVHLANGYELLRRGYDKFPIPPKVVKNIKAAIAFKPHELDDTLKGIVETTKGDLDMKTAKAVPVKKAPKPEVKERIKEEKEPRVTLAGYYGELFEAVAGGKRMTDKQIAEAVNKKFEVTHTEDRVKTYRTLYNHGKLSGQTNAPSTRSEEYIPSSAKKAA